MASTDARPIPRKNTAFRFYFAIRDNAGALVTGWTGADSEVSIDGGAFADATNEATEIGTSGYGYIDLTAAEMNGDAVGLKVTVTNADALPLVVTFFPEEAGDLRADAVAISGSSTAADNVEANIANLDAAVTTRSTFDDTTDTVTVGTNNDKTGYALTPSDIVSIASTCATNVWAAGTRTLTDASNIAAAVWDRLTTALSTAGSIGKLLVDNVNATIASRSTFDHTINDVSVGANTDKTGYSLTSGERDSIASTVWSDTTRTLTAATNITAAIATAVWGEATRTLTSFGTLVSDIWSNGARTLTAGTRDTEIDAIKAVTDKMDTALELDGAVYRFTSNALEQAPTGGGDSPATIAEAVWDFATINADVVGSVGKLVVDNVDAAVSSRSAFNASTDEIDVGFVKGVAVTGVDDFKANVSGLSTFDASTDEVDIGNVKGSPVTNIDDFKANVSGLSTFDALADSVDVGSINGTTVNDPTDLQADVSGLSTFDHALDDVTVSSASVSAIATAVWAATTRTLSGFGTLVADVWNAATRTLTAGTRDSEIDAMATIVDKIDSAMEADGAVFRFTTNALEQAPGSTGALTPSQDDMLTTIYTRTTGGLSVALQSPVNRTTQSIEIVQGDVLLIADAAAITFEETTNDIDFASATATLNIRDVVTGDVVTKSGTVTVGAEKTTFEFEMTESDTLGMAAGTKRHRYELDVAFPNGSHLTVMRGYVDVYEQLT